MGPHNIVTSTSHHNQEFNSQTLWVMVFNANFKNISVVISWGGQFYWLRKQEYPEKTTDLRKSLTNFITLSSIDDTSP
jgi:hypothetical protein